MYYYYYKYELEEWFRNQMANFAIWLIKKTNRYKDRCLAWRLEELAKDYEP